MNHKSITPNIQWMKDYLSQKPMTVHLEYVNWAMDYTDNFMFVDLKSRVFREHFNILKEACEKYLNEQDY